jgi:hypothetical protein
MGRESILSQTFFWKVTAMSLHWLWLALKLALAPAPALAPALASHFLPLLPSFHLFAFATPAR